MNRKVLVAVLLALLVVSLALIAGEHSRIVLLPTGKQLTLPVPGYLARTNSFPATIAVSPDSRYAAILNMGYGTQDSGGRQSIAILDLTTNQLRDFPDDRLGEDARQSYFLGLAFSSDGRHLYASVGSVTDPTGERPGDTGNGIAVYKFDAGQITPERFIKIPPQKLAAGKEVAFGLRKTQPGTAIPYPAGFAVLPGSKPNTEMERRGPLSVVEAADRLLIANNLSDNVVLLDASSGEILKSFDLSRSPYVPAAYPYTVIANKAGTKAWVSKWNESNVTDLSLSTGQVGRGYDVSNILDSVPGSHPTSMVLAPGDDTLYVTLSNTSIAFDVVGFELKNGSLHIFSASSSNLGGDLFSVPQAIAISRDGKRLFVACASLDAVAVFDPSAHDMGHEISPLGFIPTEWYPSALAIAGNDLLIATAKGESSGPNNGPKRIPSVRHPRPHPYIATLTAGSIARLSLADIDKNLPAYTSQVEEDNLLHSDPGHFAFAGGKNPIRHVIYILKENRTYDQILGDLPVGNGDPSLTMYGAEITPNEHKLALQFGVFDNFYDSGEVSGDGHLWSTAAATSDYNEKTWPIAYRGKERTYDFAGAVSDELPLEKGIPDVDDPGTGFLWDNLARSKLTYRIYGEFVAAVWCRNQKSQSPLQGTSSAFSTVCPRTEIQQGEPLPSNIGGPRGSPWPWPVPLFKQVKPSKAALRDHYDPLFPDFNTNYPDQLRANEFLREFNEFVKARGTAKELPQFVLLYLPDDHTGGTRPGKPTPQASVADNDLALGRVVDAISHSPYWDDTAIFVVEDDAQNGVDHVDAHRSIAFVISKYSPRGQSDNSSSSGIANKPFVDSHFYTTVSMVHTMEELLGLPPMNLFDAHAPLMAPPLSGPGTQPPYEADDRNLRNGLIYAINARNATGAEESSRLDFSGPDRADAAVLNAILWRDAKGDIPMLPANQRRDAAGR